MTARAARALAFLRDLLILCGVAAVVLICAGYFLAGLIAFFWVVLGAVVVMTR